MWDKRGTGVGRARDGCGTGVGKGEPLIKGGRKHKLVIAGVEERNAKVCVPHQYDK